LRPRHLHVVAIPGESEPPARPTLEDAFRRYGSYVGGVAYRLLGRRAEVDDVVQDVFIQAASGLHTLEQAAALKGWLAAITVRVCARRLELRRLRRWLSFDDVGHERFEASGASPEQRVLLDQIYRALDKVPPKARIAWTLRYVEQESLEAICEACGCSLATAKRRILAAEQTLDKLVMR
jgi:RNA polymerase sigma-70 factor (ECF subfamily)